MKICIRQAVCVALMAAGLVGCQSGPRWAKMPERLAWWKKDAPATAAAESSLDARTAGLAADVPPPADPVLPSTVATPQSLTAAAQPPSAKSVAAANAQTITPMTAAINNIPTSSAATIASAPSAAYPTTTYPTTSAPAAATSPMAATAPVAVSTPSTVMAQAGPYDPNAYQPVAAKPAVAPVEVDRYATATPAASPVTPSTTPIAPPAAPATSADRYVATAPAATAASTAATTAPAATAPSANDRYAYNPTTTTPGYSYSDDRYGTPSAATTPSAVTPAVTVPTTTTTPAVTPAIPQTSTPPYNAASVASATVQITAPAGQYRPGGTSTYTGAPTKAVEVASRPTTAAVAPGIPSPTIPTPGATPLPSQVPIYPTGNTSTRTY